MDEDIVQYLLKDNVAVNTGPNAKGEILNIANFLKIMTCYSTEFFLDQAENEFNNGNLLNSIFYQVRALYQASEERYFQIEAKLNNEQGDSKRTLADKLCSEMNEWEKEDLKRCK